MSHLRRLSGLWGALLSTRSLDERVRLLPRVAGTVVCLGFTLAIGGQLLASNRLSGLEREGYPALRDSRTLVTLLAAVRTELAPGAHDAARIGRADSLAEQFRSAAHDSRAAGTASADAHFGEYFIEARRAAAGISTGEDADVSSAVAADMTYRVISAELATNVSAADRNVSLTLASAASLQSTVEWMLVLAGALALILLATLGLAASDSVSSHIDGIAGSVNAIAAGDFTVAIGDTRGGAAGRANVAVFRLARQMQENSNTAHALARGAYRRTALLPAPSDPIGMSLALLSSNMDAIATVAHQVARGDLSVALTPRSPEDAFGLAFVAMTRRITTAMDDVEETHESIMATVERMRGDAVSLASSTTDDADRLRQTLDRLSYVALQARANATRGAALSERADESETMMEHGAAALGSSIDGLKKVIDRSAVVQELARNTSLLAVSAGSGASRAQVAGSEAGMMEVSARALATQAAAAAAQITRIMIDGTEQSYRSGVAFDRVTLAVQDGTAFVRELGAASQQQASELLAIDDAIVQVQRTTARSADTARQLKSQLDSMSSHARRLEAVMRGFRAPTVKVAAGPAWNEMAAELGLYRTPPRAFAAYRTLVAAM